MQYLGNCLTFQIVDSEANSFWMNLEDFAEDYRMVRKLSSIWTMASCSELFESEVKNVIIWIIMQKAYAAADKSIPEHERGDQEETTAHPSCMATYCQTLSIYEDI